jgi:XTP/dITP diphosphohydrolase
MVLAYPDGREISSEGYMYGEITESPRGERGFGYDPLFVPIGETRTVAEMTDDEKNEISHRAKALAELLLKIK